VLALEQCVVQGLCEDGSAAGAHVWLQPAGSLQRATAAAGVRAASNPVRPGTGHLGLGLILGMLRLQQLFLMRCRSLTEAVQHGPAESRRRAAALAAAAAAAVVECSQNPCHLFPFLQAFLALCMFPAHEAPSDVEFDYSSPRKADTATNAGVAG